MSDETPAPEAEPATAESPAPTSPRTPRTPRKQGAAQVAPAPEPADTGTVVVPAPATEADAAPVAAEPASAAVAPAPAVAPAAAAPGHQVVYVQAPVPPRARGNRGVGALLALLGAVVFGVVYAVVGAIIEFFKGQPIFGPSFGVFVGSAAFWVPILVFALAFILLVVIVNRGGWAAHVFGSLLVAAVVYLASIGLLLVVSNISGGSVTFAQVAAYPQLVASAIIAREVAIWFGLGIASRGRRVKARNVAEREKYDRELAEQRSRWAQPAQSAQPAATPAEAAPSAEG